MSLGRTCEQTKNKLSIYYAPWINNPIINVTEAVIILYFFPSFKFINIIRTKCYLKYFFFNWIRIIFFLPIGS